MKKILIVDDSASEVELMRSYLADNGYSVISSTDAKDALTKVSSFKPDAVVTDLVMPGMNGLELCRTLKKADTTKDMPVIACTSKNQELDRLWGMKQGIDVYVTKPYTQDDLLRAVRSVAG